jgi:hypothetical protein
MESTNKMLQVISGYQDRGSRNSHVWSAYYVISLMASSPGFVSPCMRRSIVLEPRNARHENLPFGEKANEHQRKNGHGPDCPRRESR